MLNTENILKLNNIEVMYHEVILVLKGVSIEVPQGGSGALLGANGAGKSTTLKAISGLLKHEDGEVTDGSIEFMGERTDRKSAEEIAKLGVLQVIEGRALRARPKLRRLDEPSMGLAPLLIKEIFEIITRLNREEHLPILLVEQNVKLALAVAGYGYVLESGRVVMDGPADK